MLDQFQRIENRVRNHWIDICMNNRWALKPFVILCAVYVVALFSLFRADFNYIDDQGRVMQGYRGWNDFSRYISYYLSILVHGDKVLNDISPIPQLLAVAVIAAASVVVLHTFTNRKQFSVFMLAAIIPLGLSPWFLECFSYKFDSPYMAISVLASVIPFLWWKTNKKLFFMASILGILVMDLTYQAGSGIYVIETLFLMLRDRISGGIRKEIIRWGIGAAASYIVGMLVYRLVFVHKISTYVSPELPPLASMPVVFWSNMTRYLQVIYHDFSHIWLGIFGLILLSFIVLTVARTKSNRIETFISAILILPVTAAFSFGAYLALAKPLWAPRGDYGFGAFMAFVMVIVVWLANRLYISKLFVLGMAWACIIFASAYGNALADQKSYTQFRMQMAISDLVRIPWKNEASERFVELAGNIGKSPVVQRMEKRNPALRRLVPSTFGGGWWWNQFTFFNYFKLSEKQWYVDKSGKMEDMHLPVVLDNEYQTIQTDGIHVLLTLKP